MTSTSSGADELDVVAALANLRRTTARDVTSDVGAGEEFHGNVFEKVGHLGVIDDIAKLRGRVTKADVIGQGRA